MEDGLEDGLQQRVELAVLGPKNGLRGDRAEEAAVRRDEVIKPGRGGQLLQELIPRALNHLKHQVVLQVENEMHHLIPQQVALVENGIAVLSSEELVARGAPVLPPHARQGVLDTLEAPEEGERLAVLREGVHREDRVERSLDAIVERKRVPARPSRILRQPDVEALEQHRDVTLGSTKLGAVGCGAHRVLHV